MKKLCSFLLILFCAAFTMLIFAGCSSDDASVPLAPANGSASSIENVHGLVLSRDGREVAFVEEVKIDGFVTVPMGRNSEVFEVEFMDENWEIINVDEKYYSLAWKHEDSGIATFDKPDSLNEWQFHIHGKKPGSSAFKLHLENSKGIEYSSPPIRLEVR
ncbi:MAG: hypothetical protein GXO75_10395 [Calditrichaeota bacterium]|nr:hypothetical protein [Calditrichota bacterium]